MAHAFEILVDDPKLIKTVAGFEQIRVYRSTTGPAGPYVLLNSGLQTLDASTYIYLFRDATGKPDYWYKTAYYSTDSDTEDEQSAPMRAGQILYCRAQEVKDRIMETSSGTTQAEIADQTIISNVRAATSLINEYLHGRHFEQVYETRYFTAPRTPYFGRRYGTDAGQALELFRDDLVSVTSLQCDYSDGMQEVVENWVEGQDYRLTRMGGASSIGAKPFDRLEVLRSITLKSGFFPRGYRAVKISGIWGWPANRYTGSSIPEEVKEAAIQIAARMYGGRANGYTTVKGNVDLSGSMRVMDNLLNKDALQALQSYRRKLVVGGDDTHYSTERVAL